jgi:hypothetical protein
MYQAMWVDDGRFIARGMTPEAAAEMAAYHHCPCRWRGTRCRHAQCAGHLPHAHL